MECQSRFTILVKVKGKDTENVVGALSKQMRSYLNLLRQSLIWVRGTEMAAHTNFSIATKIDVYFCGPRSPWQRGTNENTNELLRQHFPKGNCLSRYSQTELNKFAAKLNYRPKNAQLSNIS